MAVADPTRRAVQAKAKPETRCPQCGGTSWATVAGDRTDPMVTVKCWSGRGRIGGCPFEIPITRQDIIALAACKAGGGE